MRRAHVISEKVISYNSNLPIFVVCLLILFVIFGNVSSLLAASESKNPAVKIKPILSEPEIFTWKKYSAAHRVWGKKVLHANYEKYGKRSDKWDATVARFLGSYAIFREAPSKNDTNEIFRLSRELTAKECTDPYIIYLQGNVLSNVGKSSDAEPLVRKGLELLEVSNYPRICCFYAARRLLSITEIIKSGKKNDIKELTEKKLRYLAQAAADVDFTGGNQRYYMEETLRELGDACSLSANTKYLMQELDKNDKADPWISCIVRGLYHIRKGWDARGSSWASSVTDKGWKVFKDELALARTNLVKAYELHPEFPEAATHMITVCMASSDHQNERIWFDRAVAVHFDYLPAYDNLFCALKPRWGGSHEQMYKLGQACLYTKRFDTKVPRQFLRALWDIGSEMDDWRDAYKHPGVYDDCKIFFEGAMEEPSHASSRNYNKSIYAVTAWAAGQYADAKRIFDELGDSLDSSVFKQFSTSSAVVLSDVHLRTGSSGAEFAKAETLFLNKQSLEALPAYEALYKKVGENAEARLLIQDRLAVLRMKEGFMKGESVNLMPNADLAGWEKKAGDWVLEKDGILKGTSRNTDDNLMLLCKYQLEGDYEIRGDAEAPYDVGIVLGYERKLGIRFVTFQVDAHRKKALISNQFFWDRIESDIIPLKRNSFLVRVKDSKITATVNDKPIFTEQAIAEDLWSPGSGFIGLGGAYEKCGGWTVKYYNLQLRRIQ